MNRNVITFSDKEEHAMDIDGVIHRGGHNLRLDAAIIENCSVMVGADSGLLHLAGAVQTPILGLFGSVPPMSRLSYYPNASWIWNNEMPCIGCYYKHNCPPHNNIVKPCMLKITVDDVIKHLNNKLNNLEKVPTKWKDSLPFVEVHTDHRA